MRPERARNWLLGLLLVFATVMVYKPAWQAGFIWDDDIYVTNNRLLNRAGRAEAGSGFAQLAVAVFPVGLHAAV